MDSDSSHTTEVTVEAEAWQSAVTDPVGPATRAVAAALRTAAVPLPSPPEVSVLLAGDGRVRELNRDWRGKDRPPKFLPFPAGGPGMPLPPEGPLPLGDVAVALETVLREAAAEGKTPEAHPAPLVVHGTLHLLGHDHEAEDEAERMEALEVRALEALGITDPYAAPVRE